MTATASSAVSGTAKAPRDPLDVPRAYCNRIPAAAGRRNLSRWNQTPHRPVLKRGNETRSTALSRNLTCSNECKFRASPDYCDCSPRPTIPSGLSAQTTKLAQSGSHSMNNVQEAVRRQSEERAHAAPVRGHAARSDRAAVPQRVLEQPRAGHLRRRRDRRAALQLDRQVRLGHRLAELHAPARAGERHHEDRSHTWHVAHGSSLDARRLAPRPPVRRRPAPTGMRYCMNSASLRFIPASKLVAEGYGEYAHLFTKK